MIRVERIRKLGLDIPTTCAHVVLSGFSSCALYLQSDLAVSGRFFLVALPTLQLSDCPAPWYSLKLGDLTTLGLCNVPFRFRQDMEEFLATSSCIYTRPHASVSQLFPWFSPVAAFNTFQKINLLSSSALFNRKSTFDGCSMAVLGNTVDNTSQARIQTRM